MDSDSNGKQKTDLIHLFTLTNTNRKMDRASRTNMLSSERDLFGRWDDEEMRWKWKRIILNRHWMLLHEALKKNHMLKLKFHFEANTPFDSCWKTSWKRWISMCTFESDLENPVKSVPGLCAPWIHRIGIHYFPNCTNYYTQSNRWNALIVK